MILKRSFLSFLFVLFLFSSALASKEADALAKFIKKNGITSNSMSVKIVDLENNQTIVTHNSTLPLIPASIMKSITIAALLNSSGPDWCYHTHIYTDGPNDLGYLRGNIIIEGAGDPTINSEKEPYTEDIITEIINALNYQRINRIEGNIIIDENNFSGASHPESWVKEDKAKYYGTGSHAFNFNDNAKGDFSVSNPSKNFIELLESQLEANGIIIEKNAIPEGRRIQIYDHVSAPIDEIMRSCMMRSDNMFAESMLRTYGKIEGGDGSTPQAVAKEKELWMKLDLPMEGMQIVDGSGLSRSNRVTADFMAELLKTMSTNPHYASFFPLAGQEGTLRKFLKETPLDSYVAMKTGSMRGIQCYAGYKLDDDYKPTHVIVIIMNNINKNRDIAVKSAENLLLDIFQ